MPFYVAILCNSGGSKNRLTPPFRLQEKRRKLQFAGLINFKIVMLFTSPVGSKKKKITTEKKTNQDLTGWFRHNYYDINIKYQGTFLTKNRLFSHIIYPDYIFHFLYSSQVLSSSSASSPFFFVFIFSFSSFLFFCTSLVLLQLPKIRANLAYDI